MPETPRDDDARAPRRSLLSLVGSLPGTLIDLVKAEIEQIKNELLTKLKQLGIGAAFFALAASILFFALGVFVAAAVLGLAVVLPGWAAALIVGGVLLFIGAVVVWIGMRQLSKGSDPVPSESIDSIRRDIDTIKGTRTSHNRNEKSRLP